MTDFNDLPLAEQRKALQAGDELHLCMGGWLPFDRMVDGRVSCFVGESLWLIGDRDIIRVVRPAERKAEGDTSRRLRCLALNTENDTKTMIAILADILADHFERGETP